MEYRMREDKDGEAVECDSCGCEAPTQDFDWGPPYTEEHTKPKRALCEFCASTPASNFTRYGNRDEYSRLRAEVWKSAACVANFLNRPIKQ